MRWLAGNGFAHIAGDTRDVAAALNLAACCSPIRSPEGNGADEAFVTTLQRGHARINPNPMPPP